MQKKHNSYKGFSILEVILAAAIFSIFSSAAVVFLFSALKSEQQDNQAEIALHYASQGLEAVRVIRDSSFDDLSDTNGSGLVFSGGEWNFDGEYDEFDIYQRALAVVPARRDEDENIVAEGGTEDPDMKKIVSTVSWVSLSGQDVTVALETYLTRWK